MPGAHPPLPGAHPTPATGSCLLIAPRCALLKVCAWSEGSPHLKMLGGHPLCSWRAAPRPTSECCGWERPAPVVGGPLLSPWGHPAELRLEPESLLGFASPLPCPAAPESDSSASHLCTDLHSTSASRLSVLRPGVTQGEIGGRAG